MKRLFILLPLFMCLISASVFAQTGSPEQEEKIKRLSNDVETLISANAELQKKISRLTEELAKVSEQQSKAANDSSVESLRDDLKKLAQNVQEVDKKRLDDKEVVAGELEKIEKLLKTGLAKSSAPSRPVRETTSTPDKPEKGYEYVVQSGDNLSGIVAACNSQFKEKGLKSITQQKVLDANPGLKQDKLYVGQKIFIPMPGK